MSGQRRQTMADLESAYEGLERLDSFPGADALAAHRAALLERNAHQADFLVALLGDAPRVLEIGCGNGRLLIDLARRGRLATGLGVDLARSRIAFAADWAQAEGVEGVTFAAADALTMDIEPGAWDAVLCITSAFAYFEPIAPGTAARLAARMREALAPGGLLCLELYPHPEYRPLLAATGGHARIWHELPEADPWRFYLSDLRLDGDTLTHAKTFIHRHDGRVDTGRREQIELYTEPALRALLEAAGFTDVRCFAGWTDAPYDGGELLVATARAT
jgi:SAM-dependent methyltransferase